MRSSTANLFTQSDFLWLVDGRWRGLISYHPSESLKGEEGGGRWGREGEMGGMRGEEIDRKDVKRKRGQIKIGELKVVRWRDRVA